MNVREVLTKNTTIYFLHEFSPNGGGLFYKAEWNKDGGWDLYSFRNSEWEYEDNICDESVLRRADEYKVLLELDF
jgi:hypothetical protein